MYLSISGNLDEENIIGCLDEVLAGSAGAPQSSSPGQGVVGGRVRPVETLKHLPVVALALQAARGTCKHR